MSKQRIYVPIDDSIRTTIAIIAQATDRSEAYVASKLISDGLKFNMLTKYSLDPASNTIETFKQNHK